MKAFMTVFFVGIMDAFLCLIFNVIYRDYGASFSNDLINVSFLIFGILLLFALIGVVYVVILGTFKKGNVVFMLLFALLTVLAWRGAGSVGYSLSPAEMERFRGCVRGIILIVGVSIVVAVPLLRNSKKFEELVL